MAQVGDRLLREPHHGGHRPWPHRLHLGHQPPALSHQPRPLFDRQPAGRDRRRVLAEAVAGDQGGGQTDLVRDIRERHREGEQRRLRDLGARQPLDRTLERELSERQLAGRFGERQVVGVRLAVARRQR